MIQLKGLRAYFIALSSTGTFEVVKWIWDGKVSIVKSKLIRYFYYCSSFLVTTLFAEILGFLCGVMMEEWVQVSL